MLRQPYCITVLCAAVLGALPNVSWAAGYEDCLPSKWVDQPTPGPFTWDGLAAFSARVKGAEKGPDGKPAFKAAGVGAVRGDYERCVLSKVPRAQARILSEAVKYSKLARNEGALKFTTGFAVGLIPAVDRNPLLAPFVGLVVDGTVSTTFAGGKDELLQQIKLAMIEAWANDPSLSPVKVVDELIEKASVIKGLLVNNVGETALKIAAFEVLQQYQNAPEGFQAKVKKVLGVPPNAKPDSATLNRLRKQFALTAAQKGNLAQTAEQAAKIKLLGDELTASIEATVTYSAAEINSALAHAKPSSIEVQAGLQSWLEQHSELSDLQALSTKARELRDETTRSGRNAELNEAALAALEREVAFRESAQGLVKSANKTLKTLGDLQVIAGAIKDPGLQKAVSVGIAVTAGVAEIAGLMAAGVSGPIGWIIETYIIHDITRA